MDLNFALDQQFALLQWAALDHQYGHQLKVVLLQRVGHQQMVVLLQQVGHQQMAALLQQVDLLKLVDLHLHDVLHQQALRGSHLHILKTVQTV